MKPVNCFLRHYSIDGHLTIKQGNTTKGLLVRVKILYADFQHHDKAIQSKQHTL